MFGPIVAGPRLRLVPPPAGILPIYLRWMADTRVTQYLLARNPLSESHESEWLEGLSRNSNVVHWTVEIADSGKSIGNCMLAGLDWRHRYAEFGFMIGEVDEWGKGYGTEIARLVLAYAFRELGLEKVNSCAMVGNEGSVRAHLRAGYEQCGLFRRHRWFGGQWHDEWRGEALREEWEARHGADALWPPK